MKKEYSLRAGILGVAILASAICVPSASASVIGHLVVGTCNSGDVLVSATAINWEPTSSGIAACLSVSGATNVVSVGDGNLISPPVYTGVSTINDLTVPTSGGEIGFMSFVGGGVNMHFDLTLLGPGIGVACTSSMTNGQSCSVPGSPFLLTVNNGGTSVSLSASGTILDTVGPISHWAGAFTTQINNRTPFQLQTTIVGGGTITSSFSGEFDITAGTSVPEPVSMALIGGGLIVLASLKRRMLV